MRNAPSSRLSGPSGACASSSPPPAANGTAPRANQPTSGQCTSRRLSQTREPLLDSWVRVRIGTATRSPNSAVNTGSSRTPPPNPATADSTARANVAPEATARVTKGSDTAPVILPIPRPGRLF